MTTPHVFTTPEKNLTLYPMEGPQTRALAEHLNDAITGKFVERILVPEHRWQANVLLLNCVGQVIQRVRSHGKWLFFDFSHGVTWLCQLITRAKWTIVPTEHNDRYLQLPGTPAPPDSAKPARRAAAPLITVAFRSRASAPPLVAILTGHPAFYILPTNKVWSHPEIRVLGPDPIGSPAFHDEFTYRLRQHPARTVANTLLDQEIVAGLGNALKCEILFATRFSPAARIGTLLASQIDRLASSIIAQVATATTFAGKSMPFPYRVYDRAGLPCTVCSTEIAVDRTGQDAHLTWYCPTCQPIGQEPTLFQ